MITFFFTFYVQSTESISVMRVHQNPGNLAIWFIIQYHKAHLFFVDLALVVT
jgi:hypothetical protein